MRFSFASTIALFATAATAASTWGFSDATVELLSRTDAAGGPQKFTDKQPLASAVQFGQGDKIKVSLVVKDGSKAKRPHQAFLIVKEPASGLEAPFALTVKESGKGSVEIAQKDLPVQLLLAKDPLSASLVLGSFGSTKPSVTPVFELAITREANQLPPEYEAPLRYGKQPEIHHIYRPDPKQPPVIISFVFAAGVIVAVPALVVGLGFYGANLGDIQKALNRAPLAHASFIGSILALESAFFLYYKSVKLLTILPFITVLGVVAFLSGIKALGEVQRRRLSGER